MRGELTSKGVHIVFTLVGIFMIAKEKRGQKKKLILNTVAQRLECQTHNLEVAGSTPVSVIRRESKKRT